MAANGEGQGRAGNTNPFIARDPMSARHAICEEIVLSRETAAAFFAPRLVTGAEGGGNDRADCPPSGALVEVDDHRRVIARPRCPCAPCRSTQAAFTRPATGSLARTRSIRIPRSWWKHARAVVPVG